MQGFRILKSASYLILIVSNILIKIEDKYLPAHYDLKN